MTKTANINYTWIVSNKIISTDTIVLDNVGITWITAILLGMKKYGILFQENGNDLEIFKSLSIKEKTITVVLLSPSYDTTFVNKVSPYL